MAALQPLQRAAQHVGPHALVEAGHLQFKGRAREWGGGREGSVGGAGWVDFYSRQPSEGTSAHHSVPALQKRRRERQQAKLP